MMSEEKQLEYKLVEITPEMAREWLRHNTKNRSVSRKEVDRLTELIRRGDWKPGVDAIAFAPDGTLVNGQHRLMAISASGVTVRCPVAYNLENNAYIDTGRKRGQKSNMNLAFEDSEWLKGRFLSTVDLLIEEFPELDLVTATEKYRYLENYREAFEFCETIYKARDKGLSGTPTFAPFVVAYIAGADREKLRMAAEYLRTGLMGDVYDPCANTMFALRNTLTKQELKQAKRKGTTSAHVTFSYTAQALKNYLDGNNNIKLSADARYNFPFRVFAADGSIVYDPADFK